MEVVSACFFLGMKTFIPTHFCMLIGRVVVLLHTFHNADIECIKRLEIRIAQRRIYLEVGNVYMFLSSGIVAWFYNLCGSQSSFVMHRPLLG